MLKASLWFALLFITSVLTSCSQDTGSSKPSKESLSEAVINWIEACEADYRSTDCDEKIMAMVKEDSGLGLYAEINPYIDPENSPECIENPKGDSCVANRLLVSSEVRDLQCEQVEAFGYGYFCWGEFVLRNTGSVPIDDYVSASLYDSEGNEFAADVEGSFDKNYYKLEFQEDFSVKLNPEKLQIVHFGFSVPDIDRQYVSIRLKGYDQSFYLPLCKKNSGDQLKIEEGYSIAIYENARLLNSCKYDSEFGYVNRLDGSVS